MHTKTKYYALEIHALDRFSDHSACISRSGLWKTKELVKESLTDELLTSILVDILTSEAVDIYRDYVDDVDESTIRKLLEERHPHFTVDLADLRAWIVDDAEINWLEAEDLYWKFREFYVNDIIEE